jgi:hypothetical protein
MLPMSCFNDILPFIYAQKFSIILVINSERQYCPLQWLDSFCMRNFTGDSEFDDTLPLKDGLIEAGLRVSPERLANAMADWFTQRGKGRGRPVHVEIEKTNLVL